MNFKTKDMNRNMVCSDSSLTAIMWCYNYLLPQIVIPEHACMHREHVKLAGATCRGHSDGLHEGKQKIPVNISSGNDYQHEKGGVSSLADYIHMTVFCCYNGDS